MPLFLKPAADPNDSDEGDADSMLDAMKKLDTQCKVFKRNAEDLSTLRASSSRVLHHVKSITTMWKQINERHEALFSCTNSFSDQLARH